MVVSKQWPAEVAPTLNAHFGSKQGLEDQHALGGAGHFVPAVAKTITIGLDEEQNARFDGFGTLKARTNGGGFKGCVMIAGQSVMQSAAPCVEVTDTLGVGANQTSGFESEVVAVPMVNMQGSKSNAVAQESGPSYTLNAMHEHDVHAIATSMQVRRLTPVECERLQGFPDGYTDIRPRGKDTPDGPRYKALGNSMAVPVMRWIGERIAKVEDLSKG